MWVGISNYFLPLLPVYFNRVVFGSPEHWFPVLLGLFFGMAVVRIAQKVNPKHQVLLFNMIGLGVSGVVIAFHLHKLIFEAYVLQKDLPLYLCSLLAILIPVFTYYRKYWMYEILVFWIIAGTLQATITPDIATGFPTFDFIRYWVVHLGLLLIITYATVIFGMRPKLRSVFKSFFALQLYVIFVVVINRLLQANYFYLNQKPKAASLLDYFGEWPYYIIIVQAILIPYFLLIYLPFYLYDLRKTSKAAPAQ